MPALRFFAKLVEKPAAGTLNAYYNKEKELILIENHYPQF
jgi:hypothetical protein